MSDLTRTTTTLLDGLHDPANVQAWGIFDARYRPLVIAYAKRRGFQDADAEDLAQTTMADFVNAYRTGQFDRTRGRLRHWLGGMAGRRIADLLRKRGREIQPIRGEGKTLILKSVPDPDGPDQAWEEEWQKYVLAYCREQVRREFNDQYCHAFEEYAVKGRPVDEVADELGVSRNAVYICKTRILARMQQLCEELETTG